MLPSPIHFDEHLPEWLADIDLCLKMRRRLSDCLHDFCKTLPVWSGT